MSKKKKFSTSGKKSFKAREQSPIEVHVMEHERREPEKGTVTKVREHFRRVGTKASEFKASRESTKKPEMSTEQQAQLKAEQEIKGLHWC